MTLQTHGTETEGMKTTSLPFLNSYRDRHGTLRYYFRRGAVRKILPKDPASPEFLKAYDLAKNGEQPQASPTQATKGTIEALVREFYASGEFRNDLKDSTKREYRYRLEWLRIKHGEKPVALMRRRHILMMRDEKCETPGEANTLLRIVRRLLSFAVDREYREDNPALRIKLFKGGEFRDWKDEELAQFETRWQPGTKQRLAYTLLLYTGQRRQDVAAMLEADAFGDRIKVVQEKTDAKIDIPSHPILREELSLRPRNLMMLLNDRGGPYTSEALGQFLAAAIDDAGLPDDCVVHGLRKTAARKLAEAGCSEDEIMSVTGHQSADMVRLYVRGARRAKMADSAVLKWRGAD